MADTNVLTERRLRYYYNPAEDELSLTQRIAELGYRYDYHNDNGDGTAQIYITVNYHDPLLEDPLWKPVWTELTDQELERLPALTLEVPPEDLEHNLYYTFNLNVSDFPEGTGFQMLLGGVAVFTSTDSVNNTIRFGPVINTLSGNLTCRVVAYKEGYYPSTFEFSKKIYGDNFIPRIVSIDTGLTVVNDEVATGRINVIDADEDAVLTYSITQGTKGTAEIDEDGNYVYTPYVGVIGTDFFNIIVKDDRDGVAAARVEMFITSRPQLSEVGYLEVIHNNSIDFAPTVFDADTEDSLITITTNYAGSLGSVSVVTADPSEYPGRELPLVRYTANLGSSGEDQFEIVATDNLGNSSSVLATINVINNPPTANIPDIVHTIYDENNNRNSFINYDIDIEDSEGDLGSVQLQDPITGNFKASISLGNDSIKYTLSSRVIDGDTGRISVITSGYYIENAYKSYNTLGHLSSYDYITNESEYILDSQTVRTRSNGNDIFRLRTGYSHLNDPSLLATNQYSGGFLDSAYISYIDTIEQDIYLNIQKVFISAHNIVQNIFENGSYIARLMNLRHETIVVEGKLSGSDEYTTILSQKITESDWLDGPSIYRNIGNVVMVFDAQSPGSYRDVRVRLEPTFIGYYGDKSETEKTAALSSRYTSRMGIYFGGTLDYDQYLPSSQELAVKLIDNSGEENIVSANTLFSFN